MTVRADCSLFVQRSPPAFPLTLTLTLTLHSHDCDVAELWLRARLVGRPSSYRITGSSAICVLVSPTFLACPRLTRP